MRAAQGTNGLYLFGYEREYNDIEFVPSVIEVLRSRWSFEGRKSKGARRRSRSPERFEEEGRVLSPDHYGQLGENRDHLRESDNRYHDRKASREEESCILIDELAARLEDAKVGLVEDDDVEGLLMGMRAISA
jgi:hypothetical protein